MILARADAGAELAQFEQLDIAELLRRVLVQASPLAQERMLSLRSNLPGAHEVRIEGDPQLLEQLFLLLIDNAVKYTTPPGCVSVELTDTDELARVAVRDTGIGIAEMDLPHIFDRFYRVDKTRSRESGGAGIGLSIGRVIVEAHLGSLNVESCLGKGTTFIVTIAPSSPRQRSRTGGARSVRARILIGERSGAAVAWQRERERTTPQTKRERAHETENLGSHCDCRRVAGVERVRCHHLSLGKYL